MGQSVFGKLGQRDEMVKRRKIPKSVLMGEKEERETGAWVSTGTVYQGGVWRERGSGRQLCGVESAWWW
jgi:hypothetical protein